MKQYDLYLAMVPGSDSESYMGRLAVVLLNSGLKYTRHVGDKDNIAARRDVGRLLDDCDKLLYIANADSNSSRLSDEIIERAEKNNMDIVVIRTDSTPYPDALLPAIKSSKVYDATDPSTRFAVFGQAIRSLGGKVDEAELRPSAAEETAPQATAAPSPSAPASEPEPVAPRHGPSLSVIIIEIILGIAIIAGIVAMFAR